MADDDGGSTDTGPADKKDTPAQKKQVKNEHILIAVGIVTLVVIFVYSRRQAAQANSNTTMAGPTSPYGYANGGGGSSGGGQGPDYSSQLSVIAQDLQAMQQEIVGLAPPTPNNGGGGGGSAGGSPGGPVSPTTPQSAGYGLVQTAKGEMVWLGVTGPGGSTGQDFQVGGGEPVYFGNAGNLAEGGTNQAGVDVYTPASAIPLVSAKPGGQ